MVGMSWWLLVFGVLWALLIINAFRPVRRNRALFLGSFFSAWLTIELAPVWMLVGPVVAALLVWGGALDQTAGWVGLALVVAVWLGLAVQYLWGRATATTATTAFGDIDYRKVAGKQLRLDVYRPAEPGQGGDRRPVILQIHGGAWVIGDKREQGRPLLTYLASHGWVGFNVNYRLSPGATFPDHLIDLKASLAWIREHAEEYGIDPGFVVVTGGSAGGHLTALMALTVNDPAYQPGFEQADTSVQAAVPFYGIYDFTNRLEAQNPEMLTWFLQPIVMKAFLADDPEAFRLASPMDQIRPDAPPFLVVHGDKDTLAPVEEARAFAEALRATSTSDVVYLELHGAQHAFDVFGSPRTRRAVKATERFLFAVHRRYLERPGDQPADHPGDQPADQPAVSPVTGTQPVASR
jgi:acetyl esterase/lipase